MNHAPRSRPELPDRRLGLRLPRHRRRDAGRRPPIGCTGQLQV